MRNATDAVLLHGMDPDALTDRITAAVLDQIRPLIDRRADRLLSRDELAEFLGMSESMVDSLVRRDAIPVIRAGRCVRFERDAVLAALANEKRGVADA
ncbi:helix-turn-helix transcriptional regulator [Roseimaritima sediminicola]|uniref:helix-turn-helix transcriptional regulator n=1 Tax=Roseimaritima sediminicola TaxID=2662066 RepID=UPI0012984410|nr:helix-turn-helix domain-containing protein [Roseimaritima sediminicola]